MKFCTNCGSKLEEGAKVCSVCGQPVEGPVSPAEPETAKEAEPVSEPSPLESMDPMKQSAAEEIKEEPVQAPMPEEPAASKTYEQHYTSSQFQGMQNPGPQGTSNNYNAANSYPNQGNFNYGNAYTGPVQPTSQVYNTYTQGQNQATGPQNPQNPQSSFGQNQGSYQPYNAGAPSNQYPGPTGPEDKAPTMALVSMILGIVGLLACCFIPFISIVTGVVGLILGIIGLKQSTVKKGMAIAGIILNALSLILGIVTVIIVFSIGDSLVDIIQQSGFTY